MIFEPIQRFACIHSGVTSFDVFLVFFILAKNRAMAYSTPKRFRTSNGDNEARGSKLFLEASDISMPLKEIMPVEVSKWMETLADSYNTKFEFVFNAAMAVTSCIVGPDVFVEVRRTYREPLNLFILNVAYPGSGKSQAYRLAVADALPHNLRDILVDEYTKRGLVAHLEKSSSALLAYEEVSGFFDCLFRRHSEGSGERAFVCRLFDGGMQKLSTADHQGKAKTFVCEKPHVTLLGFQTPATFADTYSTLLASQDGLVDRFIISSPKPKLLRQDSVDDAVVDLGMYAEKLQTLSEVYKIVHDASSNGVTLTFATDDGASTVYREYINELIDRMNAQFVSGDFSIDGNVSKDGRTLTRYRYITS